MRHTDYNSLIDHGRKAGLGTRELYDALTARRPEANDRLAGTADGNGYVATYDHDHTVLRPSGIYRRP